MEWASTGRNCHHKLEWGHHEEPAYSHCGANCREENSVSVGSSVDSGFSRHVANSDQPRAVLVRHHTRWERD